MVKVGFKSNSPYGTTQCILCISDGKKNTEYAVNAKIEGTKLSWIFSNLLKHLRTIHKLHIPKKNRSTQSDKNKNMLSDNGKENHSNKNEKVNMVDPESLKMEVLDEVFVDINNKMEQIQKQIFSSISNQALRMLDISDDEKLQNLESINFVSCSMPRPVKIARIEKNGNCLFSAIVHQLYKTDLKSKNHAVLTSQTRADVCSFISKNRQLFKSDLENRVYDKYKNEKKRRIFLIWISKFKKFWKGCLKMGAGVGQKALKQYSCYTIAIF